MPARNYGTLSGQSSGPVAPGQSGTSIVEPLAAGTPAITHEPNPLVSAGSSRPGSREFATAVGATASNLD